MNPSAFLVVSLDLTQQPTHPAAHPRVNSLSHHTSHAMLLRSSTIFDGDHFVTYSSHGSLVDLAFQVELAEMHEDLGGKGGLWALPIPFVDVAALVSWMARGVCSPLYSQVSME